MYIGLVEYYDDVEEAVLNDSTILSPPPILASNTIMSTPSATSTELSPSLTGDLTTQVSPGGSASNEGGGQLWEVAQRAELRKCANFTQRTCGCTISDGKPCSSLFSAEYFVDIRSQASLLTRQQLDLVILGSIMSTTAVEKDVVCGRHKPTKRQRLATKYMHRGYQVCHTTFNFLHGLGKHRVPAIRKAFISNGLEVRTHGNTKRSPHHASSFSTIKNTLLFIQNYAEQNAILLPGRIPSHKRDDIKLLPSSDSKKVQKHYK